MTTINETDARRLRPTPGYSDYSAVVNSDLDQTFVTATKPKADIDERLTRIAEHIANAVQKIYDERPVTASFRLPGDGPRAMETNTVTDAFKLPKADDVAGTTAAAGFKLPS